MRPPITVSSLDAERLKTLGASAQGDQASRRALLDELARANIVEPHDIPPGAVTMNSTVRFDIDNTRTVVPHNGVPQERSTGPVPMDN